MEEKKVVHSAGVSSAIIVSDTVMLPNSEKPESVTLGVKCKDEPDVIKIKTEVYDLCVGTYELCDRGLQGNVYDTEIMPPELNTFIDVECMEENTNSDNNPVQDPLLLTKMDYLDFAKRENLKIDMNLDDKNIIRHQINSIGSDCERRDSNPFICPVIKKENTETNSFEELTSEGMQDASNCAPVKIETVASLRAGDVGMEVERTDPDPWREQLVLQEDYSEELRVSSFRGEESLLDEDGGKPTEVMSVASRKRKQTSRIKGVGRKKGELTPGNDPTVSQAINRRMCSPASKKKCSAKSMKKTKVNVSEGESNPQTEHSLGQKNHIKGSNDFTTDREQKMHRKTHTGDEPFKCSDCELKCYNKHKFRKHIMTHTKPFQCAICDFKCSQKQNLKTHLMCHLGDKPFQCTICNYKCSLKRNLKTHLMSHSGEKPFHCTICDYKSTYKQHLKRHLMIHSGEKPYECTICDFKCSRKLLLETHLRSHSGDKPFQCTICDFKCSRKQHLKTHLMSHSGEKPFQCAICDYKCSIKESLKTHLLRHSGEKPFQCDICDYKCFLKQTLKTHLMSH